MPINTTHNPATPTNTNTTTTTTTTVSTADEDPPQTCPYCDRTFISHIGLVGHFRIHRTETGEPVPGAPTYTRRVRLHCPHCPRTFMYCMGLFGHMSIQRSGVDRHPDVTSISSTPTMPSLAHTSPLSAPTVISSVTLSTSCTPTIRSPTHTPPPSAPTTTSATITIIKFGTDPANFSCLNCPRTFTSRIGLVGHLRIHRTETGEPMPGAPSYIRRIRLHFPQCTRTFIHRMNLLGHMPVHENLR
ncbi:hypothetical protein SprV_0100394500 [Sparganum proliferum]